MFAEELILQMFNSRKRTIIKIDILDQALEKVLSQSNKFRNLKLVAFYSWKFTEFKLNYEIYNKELLAIVKIFKQ